MSLNFSDLKNKFYEDGFFVYKDIFEKDYILKIIDEINKAKNTVKYYDSKKNLRRVEKLYNKGIYLNNLNETITVLLKKIFKEDFLIFKDKYNAKPPNGDGFYAHYDGIFHFIDSDNNIKNGWYEYSDFFINVLIALDLCNEENGTIELSKSHQGNFVELLKNTNNDNTPALKKEIENNIIFEPINLNVGDIVIFSHKCPHRSKKNNTSISRRILYYTYTRGKNGSKYDQYFLDKEKSKNTSKALVEKKI